MKPILGHFKPPLSHLKATFKPPQDTQNERDPRSGVTPKWGFGVAMLPVGALCFCQSHFGRTVLPKWPLWAHLFYTVFYSISELRRTCFRQARVARPVLPPGALFRATAFALPPSAPKPQLCPLPHLGLSDQNEGPKSAKKGVFVSFVVVARSRSSKPNHKEKVLVAPCG